MVKNFKKHFRSIFLQFQAIPINFVFFLQFFGHFFFKHKLKQVLVKNVKNKFQATVVFLYCDQFLFSYHEKGICLKKWKKNKVDRNCLKWRENWSKTFFWKFWPTFFNLCLKNTCQKMEKNKVDRGGSGRGDRNPFSQKFHGHLIVPANVVKCLKHFFRNLY